MAAKTLMSVEREMAGRLFEFCGFKTWQKWDDSRVASKLVNIKDALPETMPEEEDLAKFVLDLKAALEEGVEIEVTGSDLTDEAEANGKKSEEEKAAAKAEKEKAAAEAKAKKESEKAEEKAKKLADREAAKAEKAAEKAKRAAERAAERAAKKAESSRGRGYFAGRVVQKRVAALGLEEGLKVTPEMIAEVDVLYGKPNPDVSKGALKWATDAIQGFFDEEKVAKS